MIPQLSIQTLKSSFWKPLQAVQSVSPKDHSAIRARAQLTWRLMMPHSSCLFRRILRADSLLVIRLQRKVSNLTPFANLQHVLLCRRPAHMLSMPHFLLRSVKVRRISSCHRSHADKPSHAGVPSMSASHSQQRGLCSYSALWFDLKQTSLMNHPDELNDTDGMCTSSCSTINTGISLRPFLRLPFSSALHSLQWKSYRCVWTSQHAHLFMRRISAAVYGRPEASLVSTMTRRRGRFWPLLFSQSLSSRSSRLRSMSMSSLRACFRTPCLSAKTERKHPFLASHMQAQQRCSLFWRCCLLTVSPGVICYIKVFVPATSDLHTASWIARYGSEPPPIPTGSHLPEQSRIPKGESSCKQQWYNTLKQIESDSDSPGVRGYWRPGGGHRR